MIKGATGANSIISLNEIVPDGRVAIGDAQKPCTLAWRPHRLDASTEWGWAVTSSVAMFATERLGHVVAVQAPRILLWVALGFVGRYLWSPSLHEVRVASLIHEAHTTPLLRVWLTLSTVASRNAALVLLLVVSLSLGSSERCQNSNRSNFVQRSEDPSDNGTTDNETTKRVQPVT